MVQFTSRHINILSFFCLYTHLLTGDVFSDAWNGVKSSARAVGSVAEDAWRDVERGGETIGSFIANRFKDTKATRAADYAVRKAAFESALLIAQSTLTLAEQAANITLNTAEKTADTALNSAQLFLSKIVQNASPLILQGSATAAKEIVDTAKQAGVGALKGSRWIVENVLGQFDITRIRYKGDLRSLTNGVFGNVLCEGILLRKDFSIRFDLDPRDLASILSSLQPLFTMIGDQLNTNVIKPIIGKSDTLKQQKTVIDAAAQVVELPIPSSSTALEQEAVAGKIITQLSSSEQKLLDSLQKVTSELDAIAKKRSTELRELTKTQGRTGVAARQELVRRSQ